MNIESYNILMEVYNYHKKNNVIIISINNPCSAAATQIREPNHLNCSWVY